MCRYLVNLKVLCKLKSKLLFLEKYILFISASLKGNYFLINWYWQLDIEVIGLSLKSGTLEKCVGDWGHECMF